MQMASGWVKYLTGGRDGKVDRQIGQTENVHERYQTLLDHKFAAVIIRRIVAQNGVDKLHHVQYVIDQRHRRLLRRQHSPQLPKNQQKNQNLVFFC